MAISNTDRNASDQDILGIALDGHQARMQTAGPGIIESFDADAITATVQPAIKGMITKPDGTNVFVSLPLLLDVPISFQRGGGCTLTFPIKQGDECLVVFGSRCIDSWWQSGGVQIPMEMRMHDLSDGFALVGPFSQATKISRISTTATQLRSDDGATYFELNPTSQKIMIVAPGGFDVVAPHSTFSGAVTVNGLFTFVAGMVGSAKNGAAAVFTGILNVIGQIKANGKRIDDTHTHPDAHGGDTGPVN